MAGISNTPFRLLCKELGSSLTTSEEISAKALVYNSERTYSLASYLPEEKPIAIQIFGAEPSDLAYAARIMEERGADIIDLNMGCPVPKITKTGAGSALMREPLKAAEVFRTIRKAVQIPFTIKIRGGWDDHHVNAVEIAQIAESEGVDSIAVHPRTRSQQYSGHAPWEIIRSVVEAVKLPITGNGDVRSYEDAERMQKETGCHSVMIGRGALGKPWVFDRNFTTLTPREQHEYKFRLIRRHLDLIEEHMNPKLGCVQMKKHLAWYVAQTKDWQETRKKIFTFEDAKDLRAFFEDYWVGAFVDRTVAWNAAESASEASI